MIKKFINSSILTLITSLIIRGSMFLLNILIIRSMDLVSYGQFSLLRNTANSVENIISGALTPLSIREIAAKKTPNTIGAIVITNIIFLLFTFIILITFNRWISEKINFQDIDYMLIALISMIASIKLSTMVQSILVGYENYKENNSTSFYSCSISLLFIYIHGIESLNDAIISIVIFYLLDALIKIFIILKKGISFKGIKSYLYFFISNSNYFIISTLFSIFSFWYLRTVLVQNGNGFTELAYFDVSFQVLTLIMILTGSTTNVLLPMLTQSTGNRAKILLMSFIVNTIVITLACTLIFIFKNLILTVFGDDYNNTQTHSTLNIMCIISIFFTFNSILNKYSVSIKKNNFILISNVIPSLFILLLGFFLGINNSYDLSLIYLYYYLISTLIYIILLLKYEKNKASNNSTLHSKI